MQKFLQTTGWVAIGLFLFLAIGWVLQFLYFTFRNNLTVPVIILAAIAVVCAVIFTLLNSSK